MGYGFLSAMQNRNPYYEPGAPPAPPGAAWGWRPSALWLPSYLLCVVPRNGYGIERTRSGYLFRNAAAELRYLLGSGALGGALGLLLATTGIGIRHTLRAFGRTASADTSTAKRPGAN
ncbi:MAG: hypothetical protein JNG88_02300 [Phycisphaerales bacterium]|nr:hypothetical protein [Phycisphaerales bacterium]